MKLTKKGVLSKMGVATQPTEGKHSDDKYNHNRFADDDLCIGG